MRLEIRRRVVKVSGELRAHVKERLQLALRRFARGSRVVVTGVDADISAAITRTGHRAGFAVKRQVKRQLARRRLPRHTRRRVPLVAVGVLPGPWEEMEEFGRRR